MCENTRGESRVGEREEREGRREGRVREGRGRGGRNKNSLMAIGGILYLIN